MLSLFDKIKTDKLTLIFFQFLIPYIFTYFYHMQNLTLIYTYMYIYIYNIYIIHVDLLQEM